MHLYLIKNGLFAALLTLLTLGNAYGTEPDYPEAPDFSLDQGGSTTLHQLSQQRYVYVDFWASWCGPCRYSFPFMNRLEAELADKGLTVIAVNVDAVSEDAQPFLAEHPANFAIHYDPSGAIGTEFNVRGMPSSFLIKDGKVLLTHIGFRRSEADKLFDEIAALIE